jgi:cholesterol transport system auxiliary component
MLLLLILSLTLISLGALLTGCSGLLPQSPEAPRTYLLAPELPGRSGSVPLAPPSTRPSLRVSAPRAEPGYDSRRMAYLEQDYRLDSFAEHEWVAAPATMLGPLLVRALRDSGAFATVSEDDQGIDTDLRLDTVIEALYQDFRARPSQARVQLRARLVDPAERRVLATQVFSDSEPARTEDPYGGVIAINQALGRLLPRIADFAAANARQAAIKPASLP